MLTLKEATARAIAAGASPDDITDEARHQSRHVGTVPFANMIRALNMLPRLNTRDDWARLAGALTARQAARRRR